MPFERKIEFLKHSENVLTMDEDEVTSKDNEGQQTKRFIKFYWKRSWLGDPCAFRIRLFHSLHQSSCKRESSFVK